MDRTECLYKIQKILDMESEYLAIRNLKTQQEMNQKNDELSKRLVGLYDEVKGFAEIFPLDEELNGKIKECSRIINLSNEIDDFVRYDAK